MNIFKKLIIRNKETQELTAYERWSVKWQGRYGEYSSDTQNEMEFFTTKEDAERFATELREAFKLLKHTSNTKVVVNKS